MHLKASEVFSLSYNMPMMAKNVIFYWHLFWKLKLIIYYCSDFRNESYGIFVLGWSSFLQKIFDFLTSRFWRNLLISFKKYCCLEIEYEKIFHLWLFFVMLRGFKYCYFGQFGTINARCILRYERVSGDLIRHRNCSKLVERSLFSRLELLLGAKSITL